MSCILRSRPPKRSKLSATDIEPQLIVILSDINMPGTGTKDNMRGTGLGVISRWRTSLA